MIEKSFVNSSRGFSSLAKSLTSCYDRRNIGASVAEDGTYVCRRRTKDRTTLSPSNFALNRDYPSQQSPAASPASDPAAPATWSSSTRTTRTRSSSRLRSSHLFNVIRQRHRSTVSQSLCRLDVLTNTRAAPPRHFPRWSWCVTNFPLVRPSGSFGNSYWQNIEVYGHSWNEEDLSLGEIIGGNFPLRGEGTLFARSLS